MPTVHALAGLPGSWDTTGGNALKKNDPLLATTHYRSTYSLTDGKWRLLRHEDSTRLFDRSVDPHELNDLAAKLPEVVKRLSALATDLMAQQTAAAQTLGPPIPADMPEEDLERLRSLGYIN